MFFSYLNYCIDLDFQNKRIFHSPSIMSNLGATVTIPAKENYDTLIFKINSAEKWSLVVARHMKKPSLISQIEKILAYRMHINTYNIKIYMLDKRYIDEEMLYKLCDSIKSG